MSCRDISRALIELCRFGELDPRSAPHLEHLAGCRGCRDEVGIDRALVRSLRQALAARVEGAAPSPEAWASVRRRAAQGERGWRLVLGARSAGLVSRLRTATAFSAFALCVLSAAGYQLRADAAAASAAASEPPAFARPPLGPSRETALDWERRLAPAAVTLRPPSMMESEGATIAARDGRETPPSTEAAVARRLDDEIDLLQRTRVGTTGDEPPASGLAPADEGEPGLTIRAPAPSPSPATAAEPS